MTWHWLQTLFVRARLNDEPKAGSCRHERQEWGFRTRASDERPEPVAYCIDCGAEVSVP